VRLAAETHGRTRASVRLAIDTHASYVRLAAETHGRKRASVLQAAETNGRKRTFVRLAVESNACVRAFSRREGLCHATAVTLSRDRCDIVT
jgi:hypothetical protein